MTARPPHRRLHDLLVAGLPPRRVAVGCVVAVVVIVAIMVPFQDDLARATKALVLVLPVVFGAVLGGRLAGYVAALASSVGFAMTLPPIGSVRVEVAEDIVALVVFGVVGIVVSEAVTARIGTLADVDRQRSLLLRSVSHDLRTPLATIRGASTELLDGAEHDRATEERLLRLIDVEATRLDRLVANLLDLSRIESGAMTPRREPVDVEEIVRHAVEPFTGDHSAVGVRTRVATGLPVIDVDPILVGQVLTNLLDNAVRHSPEGGTVTVSADNAPNGVSISVADRGPGVPADEADLILQPFRSGSLAGASGLGLAISRVVIDQHGGTISVDEQPGGGARFTVTLPAR